ncbi:hypothetical protein PYCCODRAFT_1373005 [Trametes coccinea BRFM310]|uniref:Uncharacterized protein n=1 Tax=Trametes coccinea (strain BRFM310) TaxID=1353009 RepID=A0A1Y2IEE9_TRAC3|nr:hypothetical protein PYCCODRAFT_1373005 [Trametes coccinea BRFM310]
MLDDLERILSTKGIRFHRKGNRIRCFPHVVNISVQRSLRALGCGSKQSELADPTEASAEADVTTTCPNFDNPVKAARALINKARQSGQRREEFEQIVAECIKNQTLGEGFEPGGTQLLRDVDTRWSSTFLMIDRLLALYPAVQLLMRKHDPDALLSDKTLDVLSDIREFLAIPHTVQELLSAEDTPTISLALPAYAELVDILKGARDKLPQLAHGIQAAISALEEYMAYARQTRVYALAMGT